MKLLIPLVAVLAFGAGCATPPVRLVDAQYVKIRDEAPTDGKYLGEFAVAPNCDDYSIKMKAAQKGGNVVVLRDTKINASGPGPFITVTACTWYAVYYSNWYDSLPQDSAK